MEMTWSSLFTKRASACSHYEVIIWPMRKLTALV